MLSCHEGIHLCIWFEQVLEPHCSMFSLVNSKPCPDVGTTFVFPMFLETKNGSLILFVCIQVDMFSYNFVLFEKFPHISAIGVYFMFSPRHCIAAFFMHLYITELSYWRCYLFLWCETQKNVLVVSPGPRGCCKCVYMYRYLFKQLIFRARWHS